MVADIGFEPAVVQSLGPPAHGAESAVEVQTMLDIDLYYNGRYLEIKRPDLIGNNNSAYAPYVDDFAAAAAAIDPSHWLPWNCSA